MAQLWRTLICESVKVGKSLLLLCYFHPLLLCGVPFYVVSSPLVNVGVPTLVVTLQYLNTFIEDVIK